jgi:hypothetical protein
MRPGPPLIVDFGPKIEDFGHYNQKFSLYTLF